jgi:two-component system response regulator
MNLQVNDEYPILLAEDQPDDAFLHGTRAGEGQTPPPAPSGHRWSEAIEYLMGESEYSDRTAFPFPGLVILDLNMPGMGGFAVIEWMRKNPATKLVPIIILSSSAEREDINRAYALGANAYMVKPADHQSLERLLQTIGEFWLAAQGPIQGWKPSAETVTLP